MRSKRIATLLLTAAMTAGVLAGCGNKIDGSAAVATLGDVKVNMGVANFAARYMQATYDVGGMMAYFGEDMWTQDLYGSGSTMQEDVKEQVLTDLEEMYLVQAHMADYEYSLTAEQESAIKAAADEFMSSNTEKALKLVGATDAGYVVEYLTLNTIRAGMKELIEAEADTEVSDEEAAQRTFSYVQIDTDSHYDEDYNSVEYTEEEKEELKENADTLAAAPAEELDTVVSDLGYSMQSYSYGADEDYSTMDEAVITEADKLKEGEMSGVIETDTAYYIIRLDSEYDETATESKREELINQKKEDHYTQVIDEWKGEEDWSVDTDAWSKVTFEKDFEAIAEDTESTEALESTEQ